jgi:hypothetical protein
MGYGRARHYAGGIAEWVEEGLEVDTSNAVSVTPAPARPAAAQSTTIIDRLISYLGNTSFGTLLAIWITLVLGCAFIYWGADQIWPGSLMERGERMAGGWSSMESAIYFSFVTATSVGFGDIIPLGFLRIVAIVEASGGLVLFGCVISKLVSRRQEMLLEQTHRIAFDEQLGRVRTNLHLLLSDFQSISEVCANSSLSPERTMMRVESASTLFAAELRVIHQLLFRVENVPEEVVLEALLSEVSADLRELTDVLAETAHTKRSAVLEGNLDAVRRMAGEICSECVPRQYAQHLRTRMDEIQKLARRL